MWYTLSTVKETRVLCKKMEEKYMRYFELGLGNSVEEDWETFDYSICIKGEREPLNFEETNEFIKKIYRSLVTKQ